MIKEKLSKWTFSKLNECDCESVLLWVFFRKVHKKLCLVFFLNGLLKGQKIRQ